VYYVSTIVVMIMLFCLLINASFKYNWVCLQFLLCVYTIGVVLLFDCFYYVYYVLFTIVCYVCYVFTIV